MTTESVAPTHEKSSDAVAQRPGRGSRFLRWLSTEKPLVTIFAAVLAVLMTWPTMRDPMTTIPQDLGDPLMVTWLLTWPGHILTTNPSEFWNTNEFYPSDYSYAYTDTFFGYSPLSFFGDSPQAAVLHYNLIFVFIPFLSFVGAYALARQLGARWQAALVAGAAFAYSPWHISQFGHLAIFSIGGMALAIAALLRGHGYSFTKGYQADRVRPMWIFGGWAIAAWQISIGFAVGLHFAYALAVICAAGLIGWLVARRPKMPQWFWTANAAGVLLFGGVAYFFARPMLLLHERYPYSSRSFQEISWYSPTLRSFFVAPPESRVWGSLHEGWRESLLVPGEYRGLNEMTLLPGFVVLVLAAIGLFYSTWKVWQRLALAAGVVVSAVLAMGVALADGAIYMRAHKWLPGFEAIRTPGRIVIWTLLCLAILAAGSVSRVVTALSEREKPSASGVRRRALAVALVIPALLVTLEGTNKSPHPEVPKAPAGVVAAEGPMLVLPSDFFYDTRVMYWTVGKYQPIVNGSSSFLPPTFGKLMEVAKSFPDANSVETLRVYGVRTVVVVRPDVRGTPYERALTAPVDGLPLKRTDDGDTVTFVLDPR